MKKLVCLVLMLSTMLVLGTIVRVAAQSAADKKPSKIEFEYKRSPPTAPQRWKRR